MLITVSIRKSTVVFVLKIDFILRHDVSPLAKAVGR